ncbi:MAG: c-type cytochrome [Chloroflexota bacterium]
MDVRASSWLGWGATLLGVLLLWLLLAPGALGAPAPQTPAEGQHLFQEKCAGCHSIGGGRMAGPDLKDITARRPRDWLVNFIVQPDQVIASGDAVAAQLVQEYGGLRMPNTGVNAAQAEAILKHIEGGAAAPGAPAPAVPVAQGDVTRGQALFTGEQPLANGGPACLGCHDAAWLGGLGGGSWGFNLSQTPSTANPVSTQAILQNPQFPGMREAFAGRPLTDVEIADLAAYMAQGHGQQGNTWSPWLFLGLGALLLAVLLGLAQLVWRGRFRGVVGPLRGESER